MTQGEKLKVYRGARLVGELDMSDGESFYGFTYAESYLGDPTALPLSASLPLSGRRFLGPLALPFFEGLLPEGDAQAVPCLFEQPGTAVAPSRARLCWRCDGGGGGRSCSTAGS